MCGVVKLAIGGVIAGSASGSGVGPDGATAGHSVGVVRADLEPDV